MTIQQLAGALTAVLLSVSAATAEIITVDSLWKVKSYRSAWETPNYQNKDTLILFDLDNTVMRSAQTLGSPQWFRYLMKKYKQEGLTQQEAFEKSLVFWNDVHAVSQMVPVEKETLPFIERLQNEGFTVLALTARNLSHYKDSLRELKEIGINFKRKAGFSQNRRLPTKKPSGYQEGVLFAGGNPKGEVLMAFLEAVKYTPKKVIMIDDKLYNLKSLEKSLPGKIDYLGFRYAAADPWVEAFDSKIAEVQSRYFRGILSDEDAAQLLKKEK